MKAIKDMAATHMFICEDILRNAVGVGVDDSRNESCTVFGSSSIEFEETGMGTSREFTINTNLGQLINQVREQFNTLLDRYENAVSIELTVYSEERSDPYLTVPLVIITNAKSLSLPDEPKGLSFTFGFPVEEDLHTLCKNAIYAEPEKGRQPLVLFYRKDGDIALRQFQMEGSFTDFPSTDNILKALTELFFESFVELGGNNPDLIQKSLEFGLCVPFQTSLDKALLPLFKVKRLPEVGTPAAGIRMSDLPGMPEGLHPDAMLPPGTRMAPDAMKNGMGGLPDGIKLDENGMPIIPEGMEAANTPSDAETDQGSIPPGMPPGFRLPPGTRMAPDAMKNGMSGLPDGIKLDENGMPVAAQPEMKINPLGMPMMNDRPVDIKDRLKMRDVPDIIDVEAKPVTPNKPLKPTVV